VEPVDLISDLLPALVRGFHEKVDLDVGQHSLWSDIRSSPECGLVGGIVELPGKFTSEIGIVQ
jgi:hypothetical protein